MTFGLITESPKEESEIYINPINSAFLSNSPINIIYFVKYLEPMETNSTLVIFALVAALGIVTVVVVDIILTAQEAEAQKPRGCNRSVAANASQGRCVNPGQ
jgi:hypothetical protein